VPVVRVQNRIRPRNALAVVVALSAALTVAAAPNAPANELGDKQRRVHRQIDQAQEELRQSSKDLLDATVRVERTEQKVEAAEQELKGRQTELSAAELLDAQTQSELEVATARLDRAQAALTQGRRSHDAQEQVLRDIAAETYQGGSPELMGLTMVLTSNDPTELSSQLGVVQNVMDRESATLQRLEASKVLLQLQERRVAEARKEVAERRRAAAETLRRTQALEVQAEAAKARVDELLAERTQARKEAARAKRADERRLNQLESERDRIESLIRRREAALRRKQSRATIARAKRRSYSPSNGLSWPIHSYITSPYGMRLHPIYHRWTLHDGTDFGASCGTPIHAAAPGRVIGRYYNVGYGNRVIIAHGYMHGVSISTAYNHLSRYSTYVGQYVQRGDVIGYVGTTGYSTGCHLHFMVFRNGRTVDPMNWLH
jgi:murein DD-endopeptidase MepM/ murein hydrolase activator NlpD